MGGTNSDETEYLFDIAVSYITIIALCLSLFGSLSVILTFFIFKELRTFPIRLILYLCFSLFFANLFFLLSFYLYDTIVCIACAMILHFFFLADFIWTFCISFNFYQMIVRRKRDVENYEIRYHMIAWGIPAIPVTVLVAFKGYENTGGFCYMAGGLPIFLSFMLPGLIIVLANAVMFFFIIYEVRDTMKAAPKADRKKNGMQLRVYFSMFASIGLSWLFGFLMPLIGSDSNVLYKICLLIFTVTTPIQGFLVFVSYCCNTKILGHWIRLFARVFPFLYRWEDVGLASKVTSATASSSSSSMSSSSYSSHRISKKMTVTTFTD